MADLVDLANDFDFNEEVLKRTRKLEKVYRGRCLNCNAQVENLYCDSDCKEDYEYAQTLHKRTNK